MRIVLRLLLLAVPALSRRRETYGRLDRCLSPKDPREALGGPAGIFFDVPERLLDQTLKDLEDSFTCLKGTCKDTNFGLCVLKANPVDDAQLAGFLETAEGSSFKEVVSDIIKPEEAPFLKNASPVVLVVDGEKVDLQAMEDLAKDQGVKFTVDRIQPETSMEMKFQSGYATDEELAQSGMQTIIIFFVTLILILAVLSFLQFMTTNCETSDDPVLRTKLPTT